ncbi:MAG TPA: ABC transporter substrate-binding protein, partial [Nitrososphaerales archaeon]|nr:ABC transporter substrate-binding protein [Nitrososphaerales archaeon]
MLNTITGHTVPDWAESAVYQTLVVLNVTAEEHFGQQQYLPDLAVNWSVSSNQSIYTFNLRQGVKFSNGDPFNAYAVWAEFYFWYYIDANGSTFWLGLPIFNTSAINYGPATFAMMNQSGLASPSQQLLSTMSNESWPAYVTSPYTIVFRLSTSFPFFLSTLLNTVGWVWDPYYFVQHAGSSSPGAVQAVSSFFNTNSVPGTGPYVESTIQTNAYITFMKNPNYWGDNLTSAQIAANPVLDPGHYNTILAQYKPDDVSRYTDLASGASQISAVLTTNLQLVLSNSNYKVATEPYSATANFLVFNTKIFPTNITMV